jgi:hypothetical protein
VPLVLVVNWQRFLLAFTVPVISLWALGCSWAWVLQGFRKLEGRPDSSALPKPRSGLPIASTGRITSDTSGVKFEGSHNYSRGFFRIGIVLLLLCELIIFALAAAVVWDWHTENPFDQFDASYVGLWKRLWPSLFTAIAAIIVWLMARWIARGFLIDTPQSDWPTSNPDVTLTPHNTLTPRQRELPKRIFVPLNMKSISRLVWIVPAILLVAAIAQLPHGYYTFIRIVTCVARLC